MNPTEPGPLLVGVMRVVAEPLRFKAKLAIGENAYASLRMINRTREVWDILGAAGAGAAIVKSGVLGIGAAATPIGWVALAALASGGACYGLYRWLGNSKGERVIEIPKFLNTPLDTLGLALFDLIAPLALRLAAVDGAIEPAERQALVQHLVDDWGLDEGFLTQAIAQIEPDVLQGSVEDMAAELSAFLHANPDCNHQAIATDLGEFLRRLLAAGGPLSEAEEAALAATLTLLLQVPQGPLDKAWGTARSKAGEAAEAAQAWTRERLGTPAELQAAAAAAASKAWQGARAGAEQLGATAKDASVLATDWARERLPSPDGLKAATGAAADQLQQTAQKAAAWAQEKLPSAEVAEGAAKRALGAGKAVVSRVTKRIGR